jgi:hypothetical protein
MMAHNLQHKGPMLRVARIQADEADAIAQRRVWEIVAYVASSSLSFSDSDRVGSLGAE